MATLDQISKQKKLIARLETRLVKWRAKLDETYVHSKKAKTIQRTINEIRTELEVENSLLYRMEFK